MNRFCLAALLCLVLPSPTAFCDDKTDLGSATAKGGFRNEDEIRDKFNRWKADKDSRAWLKIMGHDLTQVTRVSAKKPHGYKADVEIIVSSETLEMTDRLSIKLVSSANGFNQIDKRWLKTYATMWKMPADVVEGLKLYLGESKPHGTNRREDRMYLDELTIAHREAIIKFFQVHKDKIVSDLIMGDGPHSANWFMVTQKTNDKPRWVIRPTKEVIRFFSDGPVVITKAGNLKIGRVSMQRKGGDNGRDTAKMLQFKINPALLFSESK